MPRFDHTRITTATFRGRGAWLFWLAAFLLLPALFVRADDMVLDMGDGTVQSFSGVMLTGAEFVSDEEGLMLDISLGPGQPAHPVAVNRIKSLNIGTGGRGRAFDLEVNSRSGAQKHRNVSLVSFDGSQFMAIPEGGAQTFPLLATAVIRIHEGGTFAAQPTPGPTVEENYQAALDGMDATMGAFPGGGAPPPSGFAPPPSGFAPPPQGDPAGFTPGEPDPNVNPFGDPSLYEGVLDADGYASTDEAMGFEDVDFNDFSSDEFGMSDAQAVGFIAGLGAILFVIVGFAIIYLFTTIWFCVYAGKDGEIAWIFLILCCTFGKIYYAAKVYKGPAKLFFQLWTVFELIVIIILRVLSNVGG